MTTTTNIQFGKDDFFYMANKGTIQSVPSATECSVKYNIIPDSSCVPITLTDNEMSQYNTVLNSCSSNADIDGCMYTNLSNNLKPYKVWQDNSGGCYAKQLCKNRDLATKTETTESIHLGTGQKQSDVDKIYDAEYYKTIHMGLGILLLSGAIYYTVSD